MATKAGEVFKTVNLQDLHSILGGEARLCKSSRGNVKNPFFIRFQQGGTFTPQGAAQTELADIIRRGMPEAANDAEFELEAANDAEFEQPEKADDHEPDGAETKKKSTWLSAFWGEDDE